MKVLSIGRSESCDIVLNDSMVSRRHAMLRIHMTGKMEIVDMSQNGTFVNRIRIKPNTPFPVKRKDVVIFANTEQLNWKLVPNPWRVYGYILAGIAALIAVIACIMLFAGKSKIQTDDNPAPASGTPEQVQPADSIKQQKPSQPDAATADKPEKNDNSLRNFLNRGKRKPKKEEPAPAADSVQKPEQTSGQTQPEEKPDSTNWNIIL